MTPSPEQLREALAAAGKAHHDYEQNALGGQRDAQWPGFYAAYVLGRVGDFAAPSALASWPHRPRASFMGRAPERIRSASDVPVTNSIVRKWTPFALSKPWIVAMLG